MLNNDTCTISLLVERRISIPQGRVRFPYGAGYMNLPSRGVSVSTKSSNFIGCSKFLNDSFCALYYGSVAESGLLRLIWSKCKNLRRFKSYRFYQSHCRYNDNNSTFYANPGQLPAVRIRGFKMESKPERLWDYLLSSSLVLNECESCSLLSANAINDLCTESLIA